MADVTAPERQVLAGKLVAELHAIAEQIGVRDPKGLRKAQLIDAILNRVAEANGSGGAGAATQTGAASDAHAPTTGERHSGSPGGTSGPSGPNGGGATTSVAPQPA